MTSLDVYGVEFFLPGVEFILPQEQCVWRGAYETLDDARKALVTAMVAFKRVPIGEVDFEWVELKTSDPQKVADAIAGAKEYAIVKRYLSRCINLHTWVARPRWVPIDFISKGKGDDNERVH